MARKEKSRKYKINNDFIFVEGDTEEQYFNWLKKEFNNSSKNKKLNFIVKNAHNDFRSLLANNNIAKKRIILIKDIEKSPKQLNSFFKDCIKYKGKRNLLFGYSNISFELWILLHKKYNRRPITSVGDYLEPINKSFEVKPPFLNLELYKKQFYRILEKLNLQDVKLAIEQGNNLEKFNTFQSNNKLIHQYSFEYFEFNPATNLNLIINNLIMN